MLILTLWLDELSMNKSVNIKMSAFALRLRCDYCGEEATQNLSEEREPSPVALG